MSRCHPDWWHSHLGVLWKSLKLDGLEFEGKGHGDRFQGVKAEWIRTHLRSPDMGLRDAKDTLPGRGGDGGYGVGERSLSQARAGLNSSLPGSWEPRALSVTKGLRTAGLWLCEHLGRGVQTDSVVPPSPPLPLACLLAL